MTTLVVCIDRDSPAAAACPVVGRDAVESLITQTGVVDPEDSRVNCLLEGLAVADELEAEGSSPVLAVVGGGSDSVGSDREIASQIDGLVAEHEPDSAVVVVDSADDERLVPIIESRVQVDAVDRVVVRQARDIESTYYLLKQFLADEELRSTVLVPLGIALVLLPALLLRFGPGIAFASLASLLGAALLYKGLGIDEFVAEVPDRTREAMYSGQVSVVTYVVGAGLTLVGVFLGALAVGSPTGDSTVLVRVMEFVYAAVPWLALAALTASSGRLLDELISAEGVRTPYLNLPFGVIAVGLVVRGFAGYFLEREGQLPNLVLFDLVRVSALQRLALFIVAGIVVSLIGVRVSATMNDDSLEEIVEEPSDAEQ